MSTQRTGLTLLMLITFLAFISIGFPDAILGVAWPEIRSTFGRQLPDIGFILFSGGTGYFLSGIFSGSAIERLGVGKLLSISTTFVAIGLFGYALTPSFWLILVVALLIGFGSGAVDAGLNFYAAEHFSVTVMNWLHAFFGIGAMLGPFIMAAVFAAGASWRVGYFIVASAIAIMAVTFVLTAHRWNDGKSANSDEEKPRVSVRAVLTRKLVWVQMLIFLFMCGIEASAGTWTASLMIGRFDASAGQAGIWAGVFWGAMALGRLVLAPLSGNLNPARLVQICAFAVFIGALLMTRDVKWIFQIGIVVFGLGMAPLFPTLMSLTPVRLGSHVAIHSIGFQVSAGTLGIAGIPTIAGLIAERTSLVAIPWVMTVGAAVVIVLEMLLRSRDTSPEAVGPG